MLKTRRTKRTFFPEFRLEAIEQMVKYQRDVRDVALALELNPDHLRKWIRLYKQELQGIEPTGKAIMSTPRSLTVMGMRTISWTVLLCDAELPTVHFRADCTQR